MVNFLSVWRPCIIGKNLVCSDQFHSISACLHIVVLQTVYVAVTALLELASFGPFPDSHPQKRSESICHKEKIMAARRQKIMHDFYTYGLLKN